MFINKLFIFNLLILISSAKILAKHQMYQYNPHLNNELFNKYLQDVTLNKLDKDKVYNNLNDDIKVYTVTNFVELLLLRNFQIRENSERVFQARMNIKVNMNHVLPHLNFRTFSGGFQSDFFDLTASLIGFVFPSNWFRVKESKLFYQANKKAFQTLVANQINQLISIILKINSLKEILDIYNNHLLQFEKLISVAQKRIEIGEDRLDQKLRIENIYINLLADKKNLTYLIQKLHYHLAFVVDLDPMEWDSFTIERVDIPDLENISEIYVKNYKDAVLNLSPELEEMQYLIKASKFSLKIRKYDFLSPNSGSDTSLGYGYNSQIKIGSSNKRVLKRKYSHIKSNLNFALHKCIDKHNNSLKLYHEFLKGFKKSNFWIKLLNAHFFEAGEYNLQDMIEALNTNMKFHIDLINIKHSYLAAQSLLERLLFIGYYNKKNIKNLRFKKTKLRNYASINKLMMLLNI